jgi:hypothetical protein
LTASSEFNTITTSVISIALISSAQHTISHGDSSLTRADLQTPSNARGGDTARCGPTPIGQTGEDDA